MSLSLVAEREENKFHVDFDFWALCVGANHSSVAFMVQGTEWERLHSFMLSLIFELFCAKYVLMIHSNVTFYDTGRRMRRKQNVMSSLIIEPFCVKYVHVNGLLQRHLFRYRS